MTTTVMPASPLLLPSNQLAPYYVPETGIDGSVAALEMQRLPACGHSEEPLAQSLVLFPTYLQGDINGKSGHVIRQLMTADGGRHGLTRRDIVLTEHNVLGRLCLKQSLTRMVVSVAGSLHRSNEPPSNGHCEDYDRLRDEKMAAVVVGELGKGGQHSGSVDKQRLHKSHDGVSHHEGGGKTVRVKRLPLNRQDIFYRGTLRFALSRPMADRTVSCPDIIVHVRRGGSDETEEEEEGTMTCSQLSAIGRELMQITREMLDVSVFRSVVFVYFCCSCLLLYGAYDVPYMFAPDLSSHISQSGDMNSAWVIAASGLTSTLGLVAFGYAGDQPRVNTMHLYMALTVLAGVCTVLVPLCSTYWLMLVYGALYGFFISGVYALTSILLVDLFGMARLTNTYGICFMCQGIAGLFGPPIAGR